MAHPKSSSPVGAQIAALVMALSLAGGAVAAPAADTVYRNGKIYTVDRDHPWAQAVAIHEGRFTFVGSDTDAQAYIGPKTQVVDLQGRMAMPGLHDAHQHLLTAPGKSVACQIPSDSRVPQIVERLKACAAGRPKGDWIVAAAYRGDLFPEGRADKKYLDAAFPDTPVYIREWSFHHGLANSAALKIAGVTKATPNPEGGRILHDGKGEPTGEFLSKATWLITQHIPGQSQAQVEETLQATGALMSQYGITSVQDAASSEAILKGIKALDEKGQWPFLTLTHLVWDNPASALMAPEATERVIRDRALYRSQHLFTDGVKIFVDGSPLQPHATDVELDAHGGMDESRLYEKPEVLDAALVRFDKLGIKVKMHAVGTGATLTALQAIEAARKANGNSGVLHDIAHSLRYRQEDLGRPALAGAVMEMSPAIWQIRGDLTKNLAGAWQFKSLQGRGALITLGSDWVVLPAPNLWPAIGGLLDHGGESVDLKSALEFATINGAKSVGWDKFDGSIVPGKFANMIVLDRNLFEVKPADIGATRVLTTIFEGKVVYQAP